MKGTTIRLLWIGAVLAIGFPAAAPPQEAVMTLSRPPELGAPSRPGVGFTHADHWSLEGVTCLTCHHEIVKGKNRLDAKLQDRGGDPSVPCVACHASARDLQNVFHENCITCHDREKAAGRVTGPRTCGECHVWGS